MKRMRNSSLWLALVSGVALSWPLGASEASERAAVSKSGVGPRITAVHCGDAAVSLLDVSGCTALTDLNCGNNDLRSLDVSRNTTLETLHCLRNRLPLSVMAGLSSGEPVGLRRIYATPQRISEELEPGQVLDLSKEMAFFGMPTEVDFGKVAASDYTFTDGRLKFRRPGDYCVRLTNDSIYEVDDDGLRHLVEVFYDISVIKNGGGDDPDDPDDPDNPGVANEGLASDGAASAPWAYVQGRTIYLTEPAGGAGLGEVEAFTAVGQRVYRGYDRAFSVPTAGIYVLRAADGRRCKVMVR